MAPLPTKYNLISETKVAAEAAGGDAGRSLGYAKWVKSEALVLASRGTVYALMAVAMIVLEVKVTI